MRTFSTIARIFGTIVNTLGCILLFVSFGFPAVTYSSGPAQYLSSLGLFPLILLLLAVITLSINVLAIPRRESCLLAGIRALAVLLSLPVLFFVWLTVGFSISGISPDSAAIAVQTGAAEGPGMGLLELSVLLNVAGWLILLVSTPLQKREAADGRHVE